MGLIYSGLDLMTAMAKGTDTIEETYPDGRFVKTTRYNPWISCTACFSAAFMICVWTHGWPMLKLPRMAIQAN